MLISCGIGDWVTCIWGFEDHSSYLHQFAKGTLEKVDTCKGCTLGKYTNSSFHDRGN